MADPIITKIGDVSAYLDAVAHGFRGTRAEFGELLANSANYAQSAESAASAAVASAATATTKAGEATTAATAAQTAKTQTEAAASQALTDIGTAESGAISAIQTEGATQTANATAQAQAAATSANTASTKASEASASATTATTKATEAAASATSAANAASAAQGVLDSIPEDYSYLSEDVDQLKADLTLSNTALFGNVDDTFPLSFENGTYRSTSVGSTLEKYNGGGYDKTRKVVKSTVFNAPCNVSIKAKTGYSFTVFTAENGVITASSGLVTEYSMIPNQQYGITLRTTGGSDDISETPVSSIVEIEYVANVDAEISNTKTDLADIEDLLTTTEPVDFSTANSRKGMINSSNKWSLTTGFYSYSFRIESGQYKSVTITANSEAVAHVSFLASSTLNVGTAPTWASGYTERQVINVGETQKFRIPSDCVYILVTKEGSVNYNYTPASMVFNGMVDISQTTPPLGLHEFPPNESALNIVKRCRQMTDIEWTPAVDLPRYILAQTSNPPDTAEGQRYRGTFKAGVEYKGIPYGRTQAMSSYGYDYATVGRYIDFGTFISSVSNPKSQLSVRDVGSVSGHTSVIYASVCSGLACYALGVSEVPTTSIPNISGLSLIGKVNDNGTLLGDDKFKIGDILNLQGSHVGIITDIIRDSEGVIQSVEISECTASGLADKNYSAGLVGGVARRKGWTRWNLFYERWKDYSLYRYSGTVTYTPSQYVNVGDEFDGYIVEHFPIMPYEGEGFVYKSGYIPNSAVKLVYTLSDYAYVKVFKDGTEISGSPFALAEGADSINIDTITAGDYAAYLCNIDNGDVVNLTYPCHWSIE